MFHLAIAGSAMDPPHLSHTEVIKCILSSGLFDELIFFPSGYSEFKTPIIHGRDRQQLAGFSVPEEWIASPKPGWAALKMDMAATMTKDVCAAIRFLELRKEFEEKYPDEEVQITFVTGSDAVTPRPDGLMPIQTWEYYGEILVRKHFMIIPRSGFAQPGDVTLPSNMEWLGSIPMRDIRSSEIRKMIAAGDPEWESLVNPLVATYIKRNKLYRTQEIANGHHE